MKRTGKDLAIAQKRCQWKRSYQHENHYILSVQKSRILPNKSMAHKCISYIHKNLVIFTYQLCVHYGI